MYANPPISTGGGSSPRSNSPRGNNPAVPLLSRTPRTPERDLMTVQTTLHDVLGRPLPPAPPTAAIASPMCWSPPPLWWLSEAWRAPHALDPTRRLTL